MGKFRYLTILLLILSSYSCKDDADMEWQKQDNQPLSPAVMEARDFFEEYVEETEMSDQMQGLYPGNFAPDWSKAVVTIDNYSYITVNVPIVSDVVYEGTFASYYDAEEGPSKADYYTAVGQKMIVVKDPAGAFGCYIVTIIPDEANATKSSLLAAKMFDCGDENTTFSGTVYFTMLGNGNYGVAAGRYMYGERYAAASWWWETNGNTEQLNKDMAALLGIKELYTKKKVMSKDIELPVFEVFGTMPTPSVPGPTVSNGPPSVSSGYNSNTPSGGTTVSTGGSYGVSGNNSNGSSTSNTTTPMVRYEVTGARKYTSGGTFRLNVNIQTPVQTGRDCVTAIMSYVDRLFGGNIPNGYFIAEYAINYGGDILEDGLSIENSIGYVKEHFNWEILGDPIQVLNSGKVIMATVKIMDIQSGTVNENHQVAIVGYKDNNTFIYMDTFYGYGGGGYENASLYEAQASIFQHCYVVVSRRNR